MKNKTGIIVSACLAAGALALMGAQQLQSAPDTEETTQLQSETTEETTQLQSDPDTTGALTEDIFSIGSISKMYTTAAIMKLSEEGKVDLDAPVTDYIPEFTMADARYRDITVRMLINHTSGMMGMTSHNAMTIGKGDFRYHDTILDQFKLQTLKADPGEYGVYCNDGFTLAELVIERVSGMSYSEYLAQNFWEPLGLENTCTPVYRFAEERIAPTYVGYSRLPNIECHLLGSGGIYSTASDVAAFGQIFTAGGRQILSQKSLDEMACSNTALDAIGYVEGDKQFDYGLGWDCVDTYPYSAYGLKALTKGGSIVFQNASLVVLPEENISAAMIVSGGSGDEATYALQDLVLEILQEEGVIEKKDLSVQVAEEPALQELPEEMLDYAGYYMSNQLLKVSFSEEGKLRVESADGDYDLVQEYGYAGDGKFVPLDGAYLNRQGELAYSNNGNVGTGEMFFRTEENGATYIFGSAYETVYGLGETATTIPFAEKIDETTVTGNVPEAYKERDGKKYFLTDSVYNSWTFYTYPIVELQIYDTPTGFISTENRADYARITDENHAVNEVDLPVMLGRDLKTYEFSKTQKGEQLKLSSLTYISEDAVLPITELTEKVKMTQNEGTAWFHVTEDYGGRSIHITVPDRGAFYLYDNDGECVATNIMQKDYDSLLLPKDGYLVFVGEKQSEFMVKFD